MDSRLGSDAASAGGRKAGGWKRGRWAGPLVLPQPMVTGLAASIIYRSAQVHQRLLNLVLGLDRLGVGLVDTLRRDHVDQLGRDVDVGAFQRARLQGPVAAG